MSYTPLKTINGDSIKGTGNLVVSGGGVSDGDYGDITVSSSGTVWNIDAATVGVTELSATGTPSATTFLRGDNTWATPNNNPEGWTTIVKSANQDVTNSATFTDDTELQFSVVAGGHYMVEMNLCWSGNNGTSDYKCRLSIASGVLNGYGIALVSDQPTPRQIAGNTLNADMGTFNLISVNIDVLNTATINFNFNPSVNSILKFQFANAAAAVGRISRTWKGSILKYKRID